MVLYVVVAALAEAGIYAASAGQGRPRFCSYPPQAWCTLFSTSPRPSAGRSGEADAGSSSLRLTRGPSEFLLSDSARLGSPGFSPCIIWGGQTWGFLALLTVAALVGIEVKLRALCIYCTVAHVIGVITAVLLLGL